MVEKVGESMQVSYSYYEDEVRDGFYISGMMKRAWAASTEVLEVIMDICKKHNIQFFADAGTLLGAIRHKGFIPWDDDFDICMIREEYDRFLSIIESELPEDYAILNIHTEPDYEEIFSRVVNRRQVSFNKEDLNKFHNFPFVVGVDIFPLDYVAPDEKVENARRKLAKSVYDVAKNVGVMKKRDLEPLIRQIEKNCKVTINRKGNVRNQLMHLLDKLMTMYNSKEATEIAFMPVWIEKDSNKFKKEYYQQAVEVDFENIKIPVPVMYDAILRKKYGDYMKLVHNWDYHDYPFYKDQMEYIAEVANIEYPKYSVTLEQVQNLEREPRKNIKDQAQEMMPLFREAQQALESALRENDANALVELLEVCQSGAISLGGAIEASQGEEFVTVHILEEYCEQLYHIYEAFVQGDVIDIDNICCKLQEVLSRIQESIERDIIVQKKIVFLPYKASTWDAIESVWQAAIEDKECDVYVIPIPYFEKDAYGNFTTMHYDIEEYPEYVSPTSYKEYDLAKEQPDMIFIQSPYDGYNHTISIHPEYYSDKIRKYTNKLVYIPYFTVDEIHPEDGRAVASMNHFVKMPGVVNADKVIVQSEAMRQSYIDALVEFVGEESRSIWEDKILGLGSPKNDKKAIDEREKLPIPQAWREVIQKEDKSYKKVMLYHTSSSMIAQEQEKYLQKLRSVLHIFKENRQDVALLWKTHSQTKETIGLTYPQLWKEYQEIVNTYQAEGWGIYDDTADDERAVALCDAYYGDAGDVAQRCRMAEKPVMLQAVDIL